MQLGRRAGVRRGWYYYSNKHFALHQTLLGALCWFSLEAECALGRRASFGYTVFVQLGRRAVGAGITIVITTLRCIKHFWVHCIGSATLYLCSLGEGLVLEGAGIAIVMNTLRCIKHVWVHCIGSAWKLNVQLGRRAEVWAHYICAAWAIEGAGITIVINTLHCI